MSGKLIMSSKRADIFSAIKAIVPVLTRDCHKGQCGRIGVIGGCKEYTGAPYFAAISALKVGADLVHVFCTSEAAPVIKSYSAELIVHPILDTKIAQEEFIEWLPRLHSLVVGPGLGRERSILMTVEKMIGEVIRAQKPLTVDADGLFMLTLQPQIILNYDRAVLTPNRIEFVRLYEKLFGNKLAEVGVENVKELASKLGVTIASKGASDIISNGTTSLFCDTLGSFRRCGGQGDLLSGSLGTFLHWATRAQTTQFPATVLASFAACHMTRECNRRAFNSHKRATTTSNMIDVIGPVFEQLYESNDVS